MGAARSLLAYVAGFLTGIFASVLFAVQLKTLSLSSLDKRPDLHSSLFTQPVPFHVHTAPVSTVEDMNKFIHPPVRVVGDKQTPLTLNQEYVMRKQLFVGVLTQQDYLPTRAKAVYETWGQEVDKLVFFVGEDCNVSSELSHLSIIRLPGIVDQVYPPLLKAFAALQYMYSHHVNQFNWFVRADDDMYVRTRKLSELLSKLNSHEHVYLGVAGEGRKEDLARLQLQAHERYCMGGPGIFMSAYTLSQLGPHLNGCLTAVRYHDQHSKDQWNDDDVEIGRCLSRKLGVQCSTSRQTNSLFLFDYAGVTLNPLTFWTDPAVRELITVHPIKDPYNMYSIHHLYNSLQFQQSYRELWQLANSINSVCSTLPPYMSPPPLVGHCDLQLHPHLQQFIDKDSGYNHLGNGPGMHYKRVNYIPFIHKPNNRCDQLPWIRFNNTHIIESASVHKVHLIGPTLGAELTIILNALRDLSCGDGGADEAKLVDGYVRYNPQLGREYIVSLSTSSGGLKTYQLYRELSRVVSVLESSVSSIKPTVHTLLPLAQVSWMFKEFFLSYMRFGFKDSENPLHLIVVVPSTETYQAVSNLIDQLTKALVHVTVVVSSAEFNHMQYVEDGMASLAGDNSLVFITDVRVRFGQGFFGRCRTNTSPSQRIYFPMASRQGGGASWKGWTDLGLACIYKGDFQNGGGYTKVKHVSELYRLASGSVEVIQAPEPGLSHVCENVESCVWGASGISE